MKKVLDVRLSNVVYYYLSPINVTMIKVTRGGAAR